MTTHELKTWPLYYNRILTGYKTVELRKDDRGFQVGDTLVLREWEPKIGMYTGRSNERMVTDIVRGEPWLVDGYCALSLRDVYRENRTKALEQVAFAARSFVTQSWSTCAMSASGPKEAFEDLEAALGALGV